MIRYRKGAKKMKLKKQEFLTRLERSGRSRAEFAHQCGISRQSITAWINGERNPKPNNVKIMADALLCGIDDIAEPMNGLEDRALKGDKFSRAVIGMDNVEDCIENGMQNVSGFEKEVMDFISKNLFHQVKNSNQSEVGRKIGLSASQVNRMIHGKADLSLFPVCSLIRLCPQIIDCNVLHEETRNNDLQSVIERIKCLAEKINNIDVANTVESMLKGLVQR